MLLSTFERFYINGWVRWALQRPLELAWLNRLHPFPRHAHWLDVGCGNGGGLVALARKTNPLSLTGIDADAAQISLARSVLARHKITAQVQVADAAKLPLPAQTYDAVTGFGVLHHLPNWQQGVREIARVLRHGGVYYGLEFYAPLLENPIFKRLAPHPEARFTHAQLLAALQENGLLVLAQRNVLGLAGLVVARRVAGEAYD